MTSMGDIRRVVFGHDWRDLAEWARAIDDLADLSDEEIDRVVDNLAPLELVAGRS